MRMKTQGMHGSNTLKRNAGFVNGPNDQILASLE